ncbi:aromatic-L-amino-acid decarboxylase [Elysia marginata]|uniref:Aromatic-L-amino-acid decarboxylase n=1 Tax=Elysia marginata TaxID=1093978 RepID=A0AAV4EW14_9GAST|nr:aromatic-L-amino-acid decarboxylase [Elysia marginata]
MDAEEFRTRGREMVDYVADYLETIGSRLPVPDVTPGYLRELIPNTAPDKGENFDNVMSDLDRVIMPGLTHWMSPHFHAYYPSDNSYPSMLGDMLANALNCVGFTWAASPACTELEVAMMDWLAQMLQLPKEFLFSENGKGGGSIQGSASEATLVALLSARTAAINTARESNPEVTQGQLIDKLVAYTSSEHWQLSFGRRFRSLKLWFVLRSYGVAGLQALIRKGENFDKISLGLNPDHMGLMPDSYYRWTTMSDE